jgi:hypothetical protein
MRIAITVFGVMFAASLNCAAKDLTDWTAVQKLKPGTEVLVVDSFDDRVDGYVTSVSADELKLDVSVAGQPGLLAPEVLARTNVREVYKVGRKFERRLGARNLVLSSAIGFLGGIAIGAVVDQAHPSAEDPGQGKLVGGVLGVFAGPAALAAGRAVMSSFHKTRIIYRANVISSTVPIWNEFPMACASNLSRLENR